MRCAITYKPGRSAGLLALTLLCVCVVLQMLGAPVTLLAPDAASDTLSGSVLEGFSVPPSPIQFGQFTQAVPVVETCVCVSRLILGSVPFHPPLPFIG